MLTENAGNTLAHIWRGGPNTQNTVGRAVGRGSFPASEERQLTHCLNTRPHAESKLAPVNLLPDVA